MSTLESFVTGNEGTSHISDYAIKREKKRSVNEKSRRVEKYFQTKHQTYVRQLTMCGMVGQCQVQVQTEERKEFRRPVL